MLRSFIERVLVLDRDLDPEAEAPLRALLVPFSLGVGAGMGISPTLTYDGRPDAPRSVAFDSGMNLGERLAVTRELWSGNPTGPLPRWLA